MCGAQLSAGVYELSLHLSLRAVGKAKVSGEASQQYWVRPLPAVPRAGVNSKRLERL